jgi:hypothetical protein
MCFTLFLSNFRARILKIEVGGKSKRGQILTGLHGAAAI